MLSKILSMESMITSKILSQVIYFSWTLSDEQVRSRLESKSRRELKALLMAQRRCHLDRGLGVYHDSLPEAVQAQTYGFSSMAIVEKLMREVEPFVHHPRGKRNGKYEYRIAFLSTLLMLRRGDTDKYRYFLLPPRCRSQNINDKGDRARSLRRWTLLISKGIVRWAKECNIISFVGARDWVEDISRTGLWEEFPEVLIFHVDGTVIPVYTPADPCLAKNMWNSKHQKHSLQVCPL